MAEDASSERLLNQARALSQRVATFSNRLAAETEALTEEVENLGTSLKKALATIATTNTTDGDWVDDVVHLEAAKAILNGNGPGGDLRKFQKSRKPALLGTFLGPSVNVLALRRDESMRIKEDYHSFRNRSAYTMFAFSTILYLGVLRSRFLSEAAATVTLIPMVMVGVQFFLCWLLFFYTAAALRESVLKVNGSHIRPWWIHHHYWSMAMCVLMLSLPVDSPAFVRAITLFLWWAMMQSVVIVLQNRYQRRRMYTRIALGKNSAMDVVSGETSGAHGQLILLYPILFAMQGLQAYIGWEMLMYTAWALLSPEGFLNLEDKDSDLWGSRGVALAGGIMIYMAARNFINTIATIAGKRASREKAVSRITALRARPVAGQRSRSASPNAVPMGVRGNKGGGGGGGRDGRAVGGIATVLPDNGSGVASTKMD
ncbi:hypothetical protein Ndes2526B_g04637 [Nannochloris sp. 'desiccata']|nr:hypothetical protein KSW81_000636 [Chlorella desiccata (nom. nud.)]